MEDDAEIAPVRIAARAAHAGAQRILQRHPQRQEQRPRAGIAADRVLRLVEARAEHDLRHVVTARGELVAHLLLRNELRPFDIVEGGADLDERGDEAPVEARSEERRGGQEWVSKGRLGWAEDK